MVSMLLLAGCASKDNTLEDLKKELLTEKPVAVYSVPSSGIYLHEKWTERTLLNDFPFIATVMPFEFQGKFHNDFYDELKISWKSVPLNKVNWSALSKNPDLYNIIYIQSVGISEAGSMVDDFMVNIAKAYNISPANMENLKR